MKNLVFLLVLTASLFACSKEDTSTKTNKPKAIFIPNQYHADGVDFLFEFSNSSAGATTYEWYFGDGTSSTLINPQHKYENWGEYNVRLDAIASNGNISSTNKLIKYGNFYLKRVVLESIEGHNGVLVDTFEILQFDKKEFFNIGSMQASDTFKLVNFIPVEETYQYDPNNKTSLNDLSNQSITIGSRSNNKVLSWSSFRLQNSLNIAKSESLLFEGVELVYDESNSSNGGYITKISCTLEFGVSY